MSATIKAADFSRYFNNCPVLNVSGRTFPVDSVFLEDVIEDLGYTLERDSEYALHTNIEAGIVVVFVICEQNWFKVSIIKLPEN